MGTVHASGITMYLIPWFRCLRQADQELSQSRPLLHWYVTRYYVNDLLSLALYILF